jgi:DNA-binding SARP family transcriptional activator
VVDDRTHEAQIAAARILDEIGVAEDVARLRSLAKSPRGRSSSPDLGRHLARHLAPRVYVEDQGRVAIRIGDQVVPGTDIRRKVLSLLCFLLTRIDMSATRDQVLEALWPELEPDVAGNSLNQTVYFLRRVFDPAYRDDVSPEYVHHGSDVLWLDGELVASRSHVCRELMRKAGATGDPADVQAVSETYAGRFALDFAYEEWAAPFRDSLHAAYLEIVERAISQDINSGHFERGIALARRAMEVDPDAEHLELALLRLYRLTGAHSAAAEQYAHYSAMVREELGIEPPPLESL